MELTHSRVVLMTMDLQLGEEGQSISVVKTASGESVYVVGTALINEAESEPKKGRLLVIGESLVEVVGEEESRRTFEIKGQTEIKGCPYALAVLPEGHVAVAITSQVRPTSSSYLADES